MNIFSNIFKAFKDGAQQMGEPAVNKTDINDFETSIKDANADLNQAKAKQAEVKAKLKQTKSLWRWHKQLIKTKEQEAISLAENGHKTKALKVAGEIVSLEEEVTNQQGLIDYLSASLSKININVANLDRQLNEMNAQLSQVKATELVQKVQQNLSVQHNHLPSAKESLAKIKAKQSEEDASLQASDEVNQYLQSIDNELDDKLKKAIRSEHEQAAFARLNKLTQSKKEE